MVTSPVKPKCDPANLPRPVPMRHTGAMSKKQRHFIREWRKHRQLTQDQLAERIGVDRSYLSKIESGKKRYDQPFLEAAADALRCEPADLIVRDPTQPGSLWSVWDLIPQSDRPQALRVLEAFAKKAGTDG